jgi:tetratricopeptide (TPR) repeat protein
VNRYGTKSQVDEAIDETSVWLAEHSEDNYVRTAYLGLVERRGTDDQIKRVLQATGAWLGKNSDDTSVRTAYLGLVERKGSPRTRARVIRKNRVWLANHSDDITVRTAYLRLVERKGTDNQVSHLLRATSAWLAKHSTDTSVRTAYLGLVERKGRDEQVTRVLQETQTWIDSHPEAINVWERLISSLVKRGKVDDAVALAEKAVAIHSDNRNLAQHYLSLIQGQLDDQAVEGLYADLISAHPTAADIKLSYVKWLQGRDLGKAKIIVESLIKAEPANSYAKQRYGRVLLDLKRYRPAANQFSSALKKHIGNQMAHEGFAQAFLGMGNKAAGREDPEQAKLYFGKAEDEFRQAIYWAGVQKKPQAFFYASLGWFYIERERWPAALQAFEQAILENPDDFKNYWGQGCAFMGSRQLELAADALRTALEKAPEHLQPHSRDEILVMHQRCQDEAGDGVTAPQ